MISDDLILITTNLKKKQCLPKLNLKSVGCDNNNLLILSVHRMDQKNTPKRTQTQLSSEKHHTKLSKIQLRVAKAQLSSEKQH